MVKFFSKNGALLRAIGVISSVSILVTGVTFATLQSQQASLTGNSIQSATAGLLIGTASPTSTAYSSTHSGFTFSNVVPGGPAMPVSGNTFYLKNSGSATLTLKMAVSSTPTNTANVDLSKVTIVITRVDTNATQYATLQSLVDGYATGGGLVLNDTLAPSSTGTTYTVSVSMAVDAFTATSATIGAIDFVFTGSATQAN